MEQANSPHLSWTCPSCGRRVPRRVAECRCGCQQPDAPVDDVTAGPPVIESAQQISGLRGVLVSLAVVVAGIAVMFAMRDPSPSPTSAKATDALSEPVTPAPPRSE